MPKRPNDEILTTAETCRYLKVAPRTLYRYIQERRVPAFKLGKDWRFVKSELEQWLRKKSREQFRKVRRGDS
jgi:excisionase family DNA binding protein